MADRSLKDLNYGHPGAANYDLENGEWSFARQYTTRLLKQVRTRQTTQHAATQVVPASAQFPAPQTSTSNANAQKYVLGLVHDYPQLIPASEQASGPAVTSAAIQTTTATYDPLIGSLLSFGSITLGVKHEVPRRIAALPAGEAGNLLRLAILTRERHGWGMDRSVWVEGPSLKDTDCGYWNEEAAPIQQVCFAQSEDRSSFLAVRLPTRTVLFRPVYHRRRRAANPSPYYRLPPSIIDAHPILSVRLEQTGGAPHADIAFNPDFQLQFGIVDQNQTWSVWDIEHGRKGDAYTISCLVQGQIDPSEDASLVGEDGWSRILWVGDVNTVLVCNRRQLSVVDVRGGSVTYLACSALFSKRSTDWILDVKRHPKYRGRFLVLTSTRLVLMTVTTSSEALDATVGEAGATVLLSWRHYRGAEDFTLQFSVQMLSDDEFCVLLHSRINHLVQVYTFIEQLSSSSGHVLSSDPSMVELTIDGSEHITQILMEAMQYGEIGQGAYESALGRSYMERGIKFYRLLLTRSDLSVHETATYTHEFAGSFVSKSSLRRLLSTHKADISPRTDVVVENFDWTRVKHPVKHPRRTEVIDEEDDFIVLNALNAVEGLKSKFALQAPKWAPRRALPDALDYELLYDALVRTENNDQGLAQSVDIAVVTNQLEQMLVNESDYSSLPLGTLMEFAGQKIDVSDIDEASSNLRQLLPSDDRQGIAEVQRVASACVLDLIEDEEPTITDLYDSILQNWVAPLPSSTSIRVRQHKERLARRIAAEVMLAGFRIRLHESPEPTSEGQRGPSQDSGVSLPVWPSKPIQRIQTSTPQWQSSQTLPTPPHSSIPNSSQPPSSLPASPLPPLAPFDPFSRLSRHLQVKRSSTTLTSLPLFVNEFLAHWQPGADPRAYDYDATERALQPESLDESTQQQRERDQKRKERRQKRQQREDELMRAKSASQPIVFPRSSPGPVLSGMGSSSQIPSQTHSQVPIPGTGFRGPGGLDILAPMSQVEPGRFGGRPDKKKKKKGRVSGF